jgi:peroxiredoxin Q/BCP
MRIHRGVTVGILSLLGITATASDLKEGTKAPAIEALDQHGKTVKLSDFHGKASVVLYFYPKDDTPGCTKQACSLRDGHGALLSAGAVVLGVSADDVKSHKAFSEKFNLPFSILADPDSKIIQAYGVKMPVVGMAKRITFLIDKQGIIRKILSEIDTKQHDRQVLEALKGI